MAIEPLRRSSLLHASCIRPTRLEAVGPKSLNQRPSGCRMTSKLWIHFRDVGVDLREGEGAYECCIASTPVAVMAFMRIVFPTVSKASSRRQHQFHRAVGSPRHPSDTDCIWRGKISINPAFSSSPTRENGVDATNTQAKMSPELPFQVIPCLDSLPQRAIRGKLRPWHMAARRRSVST
jgi:hypothetical protein